MGKPETTAPITARMIWDMLVYWLRGGDWVIEYHGKAISTIPFETRSEARMTARRAGIDPAYYRVVRLYKSST